MTRRRVQTVRIFGDKVDAEGDGAAAFDIRALDDLAISDEPRKTWVTPNKETRKASVSESLLDPNELAVNDESSLASCTRVSCSRQFEISSVVVVTNELRGGSSSCINQASICLSS